MAEYLHGVYARFQEDGRVGVHAEFFDPENAAQPMRVVALHTADFSATDKRKIQDVFADHVEQFLSAQSQVNFKLDEAISKINAYEERFGALESDVKATAEILLAAANAATPKTETPPE